MAQDGQVEILASLEQASVNKALLNYVCEDSQRMVAVITPGRRLYVNVGVEQLYIDSNPHIHMFLSCFLAFISMAQVGHIFSATNQSLDKQAFFFSKAL